MKKIYRFHNFINESHENYEDEFRYIFMDLIDDRYELEIENIFFNSEGYPSQTKDSSYKKLGYRLKIRSEEDQIEFDFDMARKVIDILGECHDRLKDYGKVRIDSFRYDGHINSEFYLILDEEVEVSDKEGFYEFFKIIKTVFSRSYSVTAKSFKLEENKNNILLIPVNSDIRIKQLLTPVKNLINNKFKNKIRYIGGYKYDYNITLDSDKINIEYIGHTERPRREEPEPEEDEF